jgi:hypothetical protein
MKRFMTKGVRLFLLLALGSLVSCVGGPQIKFDKLPSKEFVLTRIDFMTFVAIYSDNMDMVMPKLPFREIADQIEASHGVRIDTSLFSEETISNNMKADTFKRNDGYTGSILNRQEKIVEIPFYSVSFDTDKTQTVSFDLGRGVTRPELYAIVTFRIWEGGEITAENRYTLFLPYWSPAPVVADRNNAAVVRLGRLLSVMFVDYDPGILYYPNNMAAERSFYVVPDVEHDIMCTYNGGRGAVFDDCHWQGKLEAGKKYVLNKVLGFNRELRLTEDTP